MPSKYPNIHLAMSVIGSFNQFASMKQNHRTISLCIWRMGKGTEEYKSAIEESMLLEASLFGKRCHFGKNAPVLPQFPFSFFFEQRNKVKKSL